MMNQGTGAAAGGPRWRCTEVSAPAAGSQLITCRFVAEGLAELRGNLQGATGARLEWDLPAQARERVRANQVYGHDALAAPWWRCLDLAAPAPGAATLTARFQAEGLADLRGDLQGAKNGRWEVDLPSAAVGRFRAGGVYRHADLEAAEQLAGAHG